MYIFRFFCTSLLLMSLFITFPNFSYRPYSYFYKCKYLQAVSDYLYWRTTEFVSNADSRASMSKVLWKSLSLVSIVNIVEYRLISHKANTISAA